MTVSVIITVYDSSKDSSTSNLNNAGHACSQFFHKMTWMQLTIDVPSLL